VLQGLEGRLLRYCLVFKACGYLEPVKRANDLSDVTGFGSFDSGTRSVGGGLSEIQGGCSEENCGSQVLSR